MGQTLLNKIIPYIASIRSDVNAIWLMREGSKLTNL